MNFPLELINKIFSYSSSPNAKLFNNIIIAYNDPWDNNAEYEITFTSFYFHNQQLKKTRRKHFSSLMDPPVFEFL